MTRPRRMVLVTMAALVAAFVTYAGFTLPPAARQLPPAMAPGQVAGVFHVHTNRAGGSGSLDDVAAAAADAGLQFVVVTDHGDATREPDPPHYRKGVLMIDGVEVSTKAGHLVVVGLPHGSPYPLGAGGRDTIADVHRMGGFAVAAHPDSPKPGLGWTDPGAPVDGIEWLNADSEWRDEGPGALLLTIAHYLLRPSESVASVFDRPAPSLRRWDALLAERPMVGLAAVDAHARIGLEAPEESTSGGTFLARPSYRDMFATVMQVVNLAGPLTGDPGADGDAVLGALRAGATYSVVAAQASPGQVVFSATQGGRVATMGQSLETDAPVTVLASVPAPADATITVLRDGREVAAGAGRATFVHQGAAAVYRVEVRLPGHRVPWIVTNAIRIGQPPAVVAPAEEPSPGQVVRRLDDPAQWSMEKHVDSAGTLEVTGAGAVLDFQLGPGVPAGQYAAAVYPLTGQDRFDAITMTIGAGAPMRVSVQLRAPAGPAGAERRWQRSIFVDTEARDVTIPLREFEPVASPAALPVPLEQMRSLMVVVDTWNTRPGTAGRILVSGVALRAAAGPAVTSGR